MLSATATVLPALLMQGLTVGDFTIPWSVLIVVAIIVVGLLLIRAAITLVKVAILVAIGVAVFLLIQYVFDNFA
jgi:hypothetical protein